LDELAPDALEEKLPLCEIEAMEKSAKSNHLSGERLPRLGADEVEVARVICWAIKKAPVVALYARPIGELGGYALRFVSEFGRDIVDYPRQVHRPLSLGDLIAVLSHARLGKAAPRDLVWYLALGCERHGWPADKLRHGIYPVSGYYPCLQRYYREAFEQWAQRGGLAQACQNSLSSGKTFTTNSGHS
jgi:hypothetical protein